MAKITFTADDGSVQDFDVAVPAAAPAPEVIADIVVEHTDGTSETFEAVEAPAAEAVEDAPAA